MKILPEFYVEYIYNYIVRLNKFFVETMVIKFIIVDYFLNIYKIFTYIIYVMLYNTVLFFFKKFIISYCQFLKYNS